ncbi:RagB/SusD family nutrient uptake outer membrane protein [Mucilaginibacter sp. SMC90]|uniref:RagB/SusD family nutrient uptake outer membrane protein n=1 Tax=Mucilaginibacter sp. SMC90 TaxID=2929803 RepID=UPI001FB3BAEC|nr:RagB/SusD family nutrient uptake outer membrane protein [Mucilaginibacter sp. SMC90]UOE47256.1 RagB/SusD family nutrient uptake outer membrane protein [Mucilaginibacter sp. SMC90]
MRNRITYITLLLIGLGFVSCKKSFIALTSKTELNTANYFKTSDEFQQALVGVYQALRGWAQPTSWLMGEARTDNSRYVINPANRGISNVYMENINDWVDDSFNSFTESKYTNDYIGIQRANIILDQIANANIDAATKNSVTGEAETLRAFFYFDLVQYYGAVPLNLHTVTSPADAFLTRAEPNAVYTAIINDLTDAIKKLPAKITFPQSGRATIGTAQTLLANVYMVQKKYAEAATLLKSVTQLGYQLNSKYANVFLTTNKNSAESIFEVQYQQGAANGQYSTFIYNFIPPVINTTVITGVNTNTINGEAQNVPTQDIIDSYETADARLDASVGVIQGYYDGSSNFVPESLQSIIGYKTPANKVAKLFAKKFLHPSTTAGQTDDNWPVYRYSDALLMLAESLNEQGNSSEALPYLNQVRQRAGLTPSNQTDQTSLRAIIAHERRIELAFEGKRWTDLLRTGQVATVMTAFAKKVKQQDASVPANAYNITANRLLFPIPATEIQINPKITQNPGY